MKQQVVPSGLPGDTGSNNVREQWQSWFTWATNAVNSVVNSGETAARPTKILWVGRTYFDTDLGKPIWYDGTNWVDATGLVV